MRWFTRRAGLLRNPSLLVALLILVVSSRSVGDPTLGVPVTPTGAVGPPVQIDVCSLRYAGGWIVGTSAGVEIKFTNNSKVTADVINFQVNSGDQGGVIRDVGKFSPGIEITHRYKEGDGQMMFAPIFSHPHINCSVESIHFEDGTVWQAALAPTPTPLGTSESSSSAGNHTSSGASPSD